MSDSTAVATMSPEERSALGIFTGGALAFRTSLPTGTVEEKAAALRLTADEAENIGKYIGKVIQVRDVSIQTVEVVDKDTGEVKPAVRTVLHCTDGQNISAVSGGVIRSLGALASVYGAPTWPDGIAIEVKQITTGNNRRTYSLLPAPVVGVKGKGK